MSYEMGPDGVQRLEDYFSLIGEVLRNKKRKASFAAYALGLLSEGERKSMEPIAARVWGDEEHVGCGHQKLQYFISEADWDDREVRRAAAQYAIEELSRHEPIRTWIIDDTGFLKQGKHSVGVQRQYTGSAGKTANCQIGVSLSVATDHAHLPIDFELFLPKSWTEDPERRATGKIPAEVTFKTKIELALGMIERAARDGIPGDIVLADSFYGHSQPFRDAVHLMGFNYGVAIYGSDKMFLLDRDGVPRTELLSAKEIGQRLGASAFRRYTWREGTNKMLTSRFALCRVAVPGDAGTPESACRTEWLVIEWADLEKDKEPSKFILTTLGEDMPAAEIIRIVRERYRTERAYEEMKGELGLDHFEGRSFQGWHHHVSVVICCYAFVVAERARHFLPSTPRQDDHRSLHVAA
jgi:SRSO17 transposase